MRTRSWLVATMCLLPLLAFACDRSGPSADVAGSEGTVLDSSQAGDGKENLRVFAGQLRSVNPDRQTLIMAFDDDLYEFSYTDATEVVGGSPNVQALSGQAGTPITVHYREHPLTSTKTAVRIELK